MAESLKPSALAKQIHSIEFGKKIFDETGAGNGSWFTNYNTWDTYHLVPSSRPVVSPPEPKTNYVDIPGIDGTLDMSTALTGTMLYKNREGSWDFVVANDYEPWTTIYHKIKNNLHGKRFDIRLLDDPYYYFKGRVSVNEWKSEQNWSKVTLDYYLEPYKYEINTANEKWLWDPFNFETGVIRNYGFSESPLFAFEGTPYHLKIDPTERICSLVIYVVSGTLQVKIGGGDAIYDLTSGKNDMTEFFIGRLQNPTFGYIGSEGRTLEFYGAGSFYVEFQGGWL